MKTYQAVSALALLLGALALAQDHPRGDGTLRVYYEKGIAVEQITSNGVTAMVALFDTGKLNRLKNA